MYYASFLRYVVAKKHRCPSRYGKCYSIEGCASDRLVRGYMSAWMIRVSDGGSWTGLVKPISREFG